LIENYASEQWFLIEGLDMLHIADRGSKIFFLESGDAYYEKE